mmetsp:Transcript_19427/g.45527  ORF Transcript_19427/g.45527 Transcript_19427/m.45527 type:complete len:93 (-) Transcript_19427:204-482(-)
MTIQTRWLTTTPTWLEYAQQISGDDPTSPATRNLSPHCFSRRHREEQPLARKQSPMGHSGISSMSLAKYQIARQCAGANAVRYLVGKGMLGL